MFKIQVGETSYRIIGPAGEEGECSEFGYPAVLEIGSLTYLAMLDPEEGHDEIADIEQQVEPLPPKVYRVTAETTELEDVTFDFEQDEPAEIDTEVVDTGDDDDADEEETT
jgi:hypothetical protein